MMSASHCSRAVYLAATAVAVACSPQTSEKRGTPDSVLRAGVDSVADRLLTALRTDAPDSLLAVMADDVVLMPPNEPVLKGKAAVSTWYNQFVKQMRTSSLNITDRELFVGGDYATEVAGYEWTLVSVGGGPPITDRGSYIQVWRRDPSGRWLFSREVWNSSTPLRQ